MTLNDISEFIQTLTWSFFLHIVCIRVATFDNSLAEHIFEIVELTEQPWLYEMEQTP